MEGNLLEEATRVRRDLRQLKITVEALEARVDNIVMLLQENPKLSSLRFSDLNGVWEAVDLSFEDIKASEYKIPDDLP